MSSFFSSKAKVKSLLLKDSSHYCLFYRRIESYGCRGGIRTHDRRLMKTLSCHCSTLRYLWNSKGLKSVPALLFSRAFASTPKDKGYYSFTPITPRTTSFKRSGRYLWIADSGSRTQYFLDMNQVCKPFHSAAIYTRQRFRTFIP